MKYRATVLVPKTPHNLMNRGRDMDESGCITLSYKGNKNSTIDSAIKYFEHSLRLGGIENSSIVRIITIAE